MIERLEKFYPFQKGCEVGIDQRMAKGELGTLLLKRVINDNFEMYGHDNVLLGQINPYSVMSFECNTVIATANTQHLFTLLSECGKKFIEDMR